MIRMLRKIGVTSSMCYLAGAGSIGLSVAAWTASRNLEDASLARADRWGIFVGQWAPTFFALGAALRLEEQWGPEGREEELARAPGERAAMPVG